MTPLMTAAQPTGRNEADGLRRMMTWSFALHIGVVAVLFLIPEGWIVRPKPEPISMTLLMGSPGERTGGLTQASAQPIQQVAPPPPRPTPTPVAAPPTAPPIAVTKPMTKPPVTPPDAAATSAAPPKPPTTGAQVRSGAAAAATGSTSQEAGLSLGGGAGGASAIDSTFCCPDYAREITRRIMEKWQQYQTQPEAGTNVVTFEIRRDGTFSPPVITKSSGAELLDIASRAAFTKLQLPPLPKEYVGDKLIVRLTLEYKR
jgi:protein TonB